MAEDQIYWTEAQIALTEQARDAAQLAARRVMGVETRLGDIEGRVQLVDAEIARRQEEIETTISENVPGHEWDGTQLRLVNPDGGWGAFVDLVGAAGAAGWTPLLALVPDGEREVLALQDWIGGAGVKPPTGYLGASGLVSDIALARNLHGSGGPTGPAPTISVGTVTTGAPETDVIFDIHAVSPGVYEVDVTIPEGKEGQPGLDGGSTAALVAFDNAGNGFTADDAQAAIEEVAGRIGGIGTVRFTADGPPAGFVRCDGATYLQSAYPALFAKLGKIGSYKTGAARGTGGFNSLVCASSLNVAVGNSAAISTSPDGTAWTARTAPASYTGNLSAVLHTGTAYIAVGGVSDAVNIIRSVDGETWTKPTMPGGGLSHFSHVAASPSIIVALGSISGSYLHSEDDGLTWGTSGASGVGTIIATNSLIYIAALGLFVAVGNSAAIHTSPNGKTWTKRTAGSSYAGHFQSAAYDPTFGIIITGSTGEVQTSPDGVTWTRRLSVGGVSTNGIIAKPGIAIIWGTGVVMTTADMVNWHRPIIGPSFTVARMVWIDGGVLAFGTGGGAAISLPPFTDWTTITPGSSYAGNFNLVAGGGSRVVAIGPGANGIQTFDPAYDLATEFAVPNITPPGTGVIPYIKAA